MADPPERPPASEPGPGSDVDTPSSRDSSIPPVAPSDPKLEIAVHDPSTEGGVSSSRASTARRIWDIARGVVLLAMALICAKVFFKYIAKSYAVEDWLAWPLLEIWGYALLFWLGIASFGVLALKRWIRHEEASSLEALAVALPLGLVSFNAFMYVAGALSLYRPWFGVALPSVMFLAGARDLYQLARTWRARAEAAPRSWTGALLTGAATTLGVVAIVFLYLQAMTPDAVNFDASWSHLSIAQDYAREGRMVAFDADYTRCFPHLASVAHTYAFLVPLQKVPLHWMLALLDELGAVLATTLGVGALIEALVGRRVRAGWVTFFLFPGIFVYDLNIGGAADHYEALFTAPLVLAAFRALRRTDARPYALVGLLGAGAMATKLHAVYVVAPVVGLLVLGLLPVAFSELRRARAARPVARAILPPVLALGAAYTLGMAPHLARNWIFHGNPVYPFALDVFRGSHPTVPRAAFLFEYLFKDWAWRPHGTLYENLKDALKLFFTFSFAPHYSFTKDVPDLGSLYTLTLPWIFVIRGRKPIAISAFLGFCALFMWGMTFRVDRHLTPFIPLLAATTGALIVRAWELGAFARIGVTILVGAQLVYSGDVLSYSGYARITASLDLIRSGYDGRAKTRFDNYRRAFRDIGASLPKDAVLLIHTYRPNLGIDRRVYMDWSGQQGLISYDAIHNPRELFDLYQKLGVTHFMDMPDERQSPSKQEDALFNTFLHRYGKGSKRYGTYEIVEMPKVAPPPDHPWRALSLGLGGYQDGVYPIEAMNTPEQLPPPFRGYNGPEEPADTSPEGVTRMLAEVDVVFIGGRPEDAISHKVEVGFEKIASYSRGYTIFVKK